MIIMEYKSMYVCVCVHKHAQVSVLT